VLDVESDVEDAVDTIAQELFDKTPTSRSGDLWQLDRHRILCGDARQSAALDQLMNGQKAAMAFLDPPYNVRVRDIVGRGRIQHAEFAMASGEMSNTEFTDFLTEVLGVAVEVSENGAVHYVCMDWRHIGELISAGQSTYGEQLNLVVWTKNNAGQGSF